MDFYRRKIPSWLLVLIMISFSSKMVQGNETSEKSDGGSQCVLSPMAIDAIIRTKTDSCKALLEKTSCEISLDPEFFPLSLPRYCPITNGEFGEISGCILRTLINTTDFLPRNFDNRNTCIDYCLKCQAPFAVYDELTGDCNCWWRFTNGSSARNAVTDNRTCSDWAIENPDLNMTGFVTFYATSFAPIGDRPPKETNNNNNTISVVFLLLVNGRKNLRQIKRLMRTIYSTEHYYIIHVDSNEVFLHRELSKLTTRYTNIVMAKKRHRTTWGSTTLLMAHLDAYKQLIEDLKWNFSFVTTISESDFPIKSIESFSEFLSMFPDRNFISGNIPNMTDIYRETDLNFVFIFCENHMYRVGFLPLIQNIVYNLGSDWFILNREFMEYVTYSNDELMRGLRHRFNFTVLSAESFYHTAIVNSMHCDSYMRDNLRLVNWNRDQGCTCYNNDVSDLCGCSPLSIRITDKRKFAQTVLQPLFFARKFDPTVDERIIDWLDQKVFGIDLSDSAFYLQNMYHAEDGSGQLINNSEVLAAIESFARELLIQTLQYRREQRIKLEQVHSVFNLSVFLGYTFQYAIDDTEDFEIFMKLNSETEIRSPLIKTFDVGFTIDTRDNVFIDRCRTFVDPNLVTILIEWRSKSDELLLLIMEDPTGRVFEQMPIPYSAEAIIIDILIPYLTSPLMIGIWNTYLLSTNTNDTIASLDFLILSANRTDTSNVTWNIDKDTFYRFWPMEDVCFTKKNSNSCPQHENSRTISMPCPIDDCDTKRWSTFYYDVKTNW